MDPTSRPRLRPGLAAEPDGDRYLLHDPYRVAAQPLVLTGSGLALCQYFDGRTTLQALAAAINRADPPTGVLAGLARTLEENRYLDGPTFRTYLAQPVRP